MSVFLKKKVRRVLQAAIAFMPWLISMYSLYWLESAGIWTTQTPHRGKISVAILATGMVASLLVHSLLAKRRRD